MLTSPTHGWWVPSRSRSVAAFCTCTSWSRTGEGYAPQGGSSAVDGGPVVRSTGTVLRIHNDGLSAWVTSRSSRRPSRERIVRSVHRACATPVLVNRAQPTQVAHDREGAAADAAGSAHRVRGPPPRGLQRRRRRNPRQPRCALRSTPEAGPRRKVEFP